MGSVPSSAINPLVADVGSPPIPEAQAWRSIAARWSGLIDLSQAVPGSAPHPAMLERLAEAAGSPGAAPNTGRLQETRIFWPPMRPTVRPL